MNKENCQYDGMECLNMAADKLNKAVEDTSIIEKEIMLQFDTMAQLQKDERMEREKMYIDERADMRKQFAEEKTNMRKHYQKIILVLALTLFLLLSSIIGGTIYLLANYDFGYAVYQESSAEGGGDSTIEDGIQLGIPPVTGDYNAK